MTIEQEREVGMARRSNSAASAVALGASGSRARNARTQSSVKLRVDACGAGIAPVRSVSFQVATTQDAPGRRSAISRIASQVPALLSPFQAAGCAGGLAAGSEAARRGAEGSSALATSSGTGAGFAQGCGRCGCGTIGASVLAASFSAGSTMRGQASRVR
jgi:hypothetical protein